MWLHNQSVIMSEPLTMTLIHHDRFSNLLRYPMPNSILYYTSRIHIQQRGTLLSRKSNRYLISKVAPLNLSPSNPGFRGYESFRSSLRQFTKCLSPSFCLSSKNESSPKSKSHPPKKRWDLLLSSCPRLWKEVKSSGLQPLS
jgi:hypothetical protein